MSDDSKLLTQWVVGGGAVVVFALFLLVLLPGLLGEVRVPASRPAGKTAAASGEGWLDPAEGPPERGKEIPPTDPATVMAPNPELLALGKSLYVKHCSTCHGPDGKGDGPSAAALKPRPRDVTQNAGWKNGYRLTDLFRTVSQGIKGSPMNAFDFLSPRSRMALVHYVRSLGSFDHGPGDLAAEAALAEEFKKPGAKLPNRIPASLAMAKLVGEFRAPPPLRSPPAGTSGDELFQAAVRDPQRAAQTLASAPGWQADVAVLARHLAAGATSNGFSARVATLTLAEWRDLQALLVRSSQP